MYVDVVRICLWFAQNEMTWILAPLTGAALGIIVFALGVHYRRRSLPARTLGLALAVTGCVGASSEGALMQFVGEIERPGMHVVQTRATGFGQIYRSVPVREEISMWATPEVITINRWNVRSIETGEVLATALATSLPVNLTWEHSPGVPIYGGSGAVQWRFGESLVNRDSKSISWTDWDREYHRDELTWYDPHQDPEHLWWRDSEGWENKYVFPKFTVPEPTTLILVAVASFGWLTFSLRRARRIG